MQPQDLKESMLVLASAVGPFTSWLPEKLWIQAVQQALGLPAKPERLDEDYAGRGRGFGERICQNCDIRYSCPSYRSWRLEGTKLGKDNVLDYFRIAENREEDEQFRSAAEEGSDDISD
jgi:hypothetical protein